MHQYYIVIGVFIGSCALAAVYTFLYPQQSFASMPVIDESSILVHNGQSHRFTQAPNEFFEEWTISDAKRLFEQGLSDTSNVVPCKSSEQTDDMMLPDSYDWRTEHEACVQAPPQVPRNCSSSYIETTLSVVQDKICTLAQGENKKPIKLAAQEVIDCDKGSKGCTGGYASRVANWGRKKGFLPEECYPPTGVQGECPEDHLTVNECRSNNNFYRVIDICVATDVAGVKKEIMQNGPVVGQIVPNTDFLTYKEGVYSKTQESFKFQGQHLVKVVGWEMLPDDSQAWIVENTWGEDWGDAGYAKIAAGTGETSLDYFALSVSVYPMTMADYYKQDIMGQEATSTL